MSKKLLWYRLIFTIFCVALLSTSCTPSSNDETEVNESVWSKNIARHVTDDGWVYTCEYFYYTDGTIDRSIPPMVFNVMNLRYCDEDGRIQILGEGVTPETDQDMARIARFLGYGENVFTFPTIDELCIKNREELELESIDEELFFTLFSQAVEKHSCAVGKYFGYPSYALLNEQTYSDEYRIQIGFVQGMGTIDVVMIDVLYKSNENTKGYIQLYDLVKNGMASNEQILLYEQLSEIERGIVSNNELNYGREQFSTKKIGMFDFSRLYTMLSDIEAKDYMKYTPVFQIN